MNLTYHWHPPAIKIVSKLSKAKLVVTESVFIETLNYFAEFLSDAKLHATESIQSFSANPNVEIVRQT